MLSTYYTVQNVDNPILIDQVECSGFLLIDTSANFDAVLFYGCISLRTVPEQAHHLGHSLYVSSPRQACVH